MFVELTREAGPVSVNVNHISYFMPKSAPHPTLRTLIFVTTFEDNNSDYFEVKESYDEVKKQINLARSRHI